MKPLCSPLQSQVVEVCVAVGDTVRAGDALVIVEAMKMEHELRAEADARVIELMCAVGDVVHEGDLLLRLEPMALAAAAGAATRDVSSAPDGDRQDLARLRQREHWLEDASRPEAVVLTSDTPF